MVMTNLNGTIVLLFNDVPASGTPTPLQFKYEVDPGDGAIAPYS